MRMTTTFNSRLENIYQNIFNTIQAVDEHIDDITILKLKRHIYFPTIVNLFFDYLF